MGKTLFQRMFLVDTLPQPLSAASRHLQIIDRYLTGTSLRLRQVRNPETDGKTWVLQKHIAGVGTPVEINLDEKEYRVFESFAADELRRNRYFHEYGQRSFTFDIFLGPLKGLVTARVEFENHDEASNFAVPSFALREVTGEEFFASSRLSRATYDDVAAELTP